METETQKKRTHKKKDPSGNLESEQVEAAKAFLSSISLTSTKPIPIKNSNSQNTPLQNSNSNLSPPLSNSQNIRKEEPERQTVHSNPRLTQSNYLIQNEQNNSSNDQKSSSPSTPNKELRKTTIGIEIPTTLKRTKSDLSPSPEGRNKLIHSASVGRVSSPKADRSDTEAMDFLRGISLHGTGNDLSPKDTLKKRTHFSSSTGTPQVSASAELPIDHSHDSKSEKDPRTSISSLPNDHTTEPLSTSPRASISSAPSDLVKVNRPLFTKKESKKKIKEKPLTVLKNYINAPDNSRVIFTKATKSKGNSLKSYPMIVYSMITRYDSVYVSRPTLHIHTGATSVTNSNNSNTQLPSTLTLNPSPSLPIAVPQSLQSNPNTPSNSSPIESQSISHVGSYSNSNYEFSHTLHRESISGLSQHSNSTSSHPHFYNPTKSKGISYAHLLNATCTTHIGGESMEDPSSENIKETQETSINGIQSPAEETIQEPILPDLNNEQNSMYDPDFIDDPELTAGKHRTVLNLPCFRETIIPFVKPSELKEELNDQFRQRHPWINPGVTLFKIRALKRNLLLIAKTSNIEVSSLALSYVFLDKLLLKNEIYKDSLKLYGGVSLLLAVKFNDQIPGSNSGIYKHLLEAIEKYLGVPPKEVLQSEFDVFAKLSFALFVDPKEVIPHTLRLQPHFSYD